jgi:peptide/nickel transport system ATP-binding protein
VSVPRAFMQSGVRTRGEVCYGAGVSESPLLEVKNLVTEFRTDEGVLRAVDDVSFELPPGGTLGIVGESGCGKSVTSLSILRLIQAPGRITHGEIRFEGQDLLKLSEAEMRKLRGSAISMIFQEPMSSLNPVYTVGAQIAESVIVHQRVSKRAALDRAVELLGLVGIPAPGERIKSYPHQLSGGMRQRVMIAIALACNPRLLIADEPTTALDVTIQAQILELLGRLRTQLNMAVMLITHDLGLVAEFADHVVVMYAGRVVERAPVNALFRDPRHPYTRGLLRSVPSYGDNARAKRLPTIPGVVPDLRTLPPGCRFQDRCASRFEPCAKSEPALYPVDTAAHHRSGAEHYRDAATSSTRLSRCFLDDPAAPRQSPGDAGASPDAAGAAPAPGAP